MSTVRRFLAWLAKPIKPIVLVVKKHPIDVLAGALAFAYGLEVYRDKTLPDLGIALIWGAAFLVIVRVLQALAVEYGYTSFVSSYRPRDIMVMAGLIALGGVVKGGWGQVRMISEALGGFYSGVFVAWMFYLWGILAVYYVPKPFSGTISMVLGGIVEILVGNPFGLPVLLFNFWEGLAPDLVYGAFGYRVHNVWLAIGSGLLASAFGLVYGWFYFGFAQLPPITFVIYVALALAGGVIAGIIATGVIALANGVGLRRPAVTTIEAV